MRILSDGGSQFNFPSCKLVKLRYLDNRLVFLYQNFQTLCGWWFDILLPNYGLEILMHSKIIILIEKKLFFMFFMLIFIFKIFKFNIFAHSVSTYVKHRVHTHRQ